MLLKSRFNSSKVLPTGSRGGIAIIPVCLRWRMRKVEMPAKAISSMYCIVVRVKTIVWNGPVPLSLHTCQVTLTIPRGPIEDQWGSRKYPGWLDRYVIVCFMVYFSTTPTVKTPKVARDLWWVGSLIYVLLYYWHHTCNIGLLRMMIHRCLYQLFEQSKSILASSYPCDTTMSNLPLDENCLKTNNRPK